METSRNSPQASRRRGPRALYNKPGALILTVLIMIIGAALTWSIIVPRGERVNNNGYQVVYMASGQAYFGKLKNTTGDYLVLDTPYTAQDVQSQTEGEQASTPSTAGTTTLLKVSQQQYGPTEVMSLKSDQVLFWQNLRDDSKVTEAIKNAK